MEHHMMRYFEYQHLPTNLQPTSAIVYHTARLLMSMVPDGPEKEVGIRKLLEAKDCFVRAALPDPPMPCRRNTMDACDCGQCAHRRNYRVARDDS